jgi:hypothetical protein
MEKCGCLTKREKVCGQEEKNEMPAETKRILGAQVAHGFVRGFRPFLFLSPPRGRRDCALAAAPALAAHFRRSA